MSKRLSDRIVESYQLGIIVERSDCASSEGMWSYHWERSCCRINRHARLRTFYCYQGGLGLAQIIYGISFTLKSCQGSCNYSVWSDEDEKNQLRQRGCDAPHHGIVMTCLLLLSSDFGSLYSCRAAKCRGEDTGVLGRTWSSSSLPALRAVYEETLIEICALLNPTIIPSIYNLKGRAIYIVTHL